MFILEPICAGLVVSLFNKFCMPHLASCLEAVALDDDSGSESSAINAEVHVHVH